MFNRHFDTYITYLGTIPKTLTLNIYIFYCGFTEKFRFISSEASEAKVLHNTLPSSPLES